jgi:beta-glucanase (GH16 family)
MTTRKLTRLVLASTLAAALAACGGGDNGTDGRVVADSTGYNWATDLPASLKGMSAVSTRSVKAETDEPTAPDGQTTTTDGSTGTGTTTGSDGTGNTTNSGTGTTTDSGTGTTTDAGTGTTTGAGTGTTAQPGTNQTPATTTPSIGRSSDGVAGPAGADAGSYGRVTLNEEWNGSLDESLWSTRMPHWTTQELHNWVVEDGLLKMWAPHDASGNFEFNNRAMNTEGKFTQRYGWFEMEAKLPAGPGLWPSFWLYGIHGTTRPEIDIMESFAGIDQWWGDPNPIDYGAAVWVSDIHGGSERLGSARPGHIGITMDLSAAFHKYGAKWEPDGITFYLDGQPIGNKIYSDRLNEELFIIVAMGTGDPNNVHAPTSATPTDSHLEVNYVRAWALPSGTTVSGSSVDGGSTGGSTTGGSTTGGSTSTAAN